jgi:Ca2+-binding RTX toxin-like protein
MKFTTWPRRWNRSTKASKELREAGRRPRGRCQPLCLEVLEDRTLLSLDPSIVGNAFLPVLQGVQTSLTSSLSAAVPIPLIGNQLSNFVATGGLGKLGAGTSVLSDLLKTSLTDQISATTAVDTNIELHLQAGYSTKFNFDLGLKSLLHFDAAGTVGVNLDFGYVVDFTYHSNDNSVTIANTPNPLTVDVNVTLSGFTATGSLNGFLFVQATTDQTASPTSLNATFAATPDPRLGSFTALTLQGKADVDLHLDLHLADPIKNGNLPINPHLTTELVVHWDFNTSASTSLMDPGTGSLRVQFRDVSLDVTGLVPSFLQTIIHDVKNFTEPFQPVVDIVNKEIPGLSEIGIKERIRDLLPDGLGKVLDAIGLVNSLPDVSTNGGEYLKFGSFSLNDFRQQGMSIVDPQLLHDAQGFLADVSTASNGTQINGLSNLESTIPAAVAGQPPIGFAFPILTDPQNCAFQLLLGNNPALFTYRLETVDLPKEVSLPANFGIASFSLGAFIDLKLNLSVGYDASGLQTLVKDIQSSANGGPDPDVVTDLAHGFYIDTSRTTWVAPDPNPQHGNPDGYWSHATGLDAHGGIFVSVGVLGLTVSGGVFARGSLSLAGADGDGRVHLDQLVNQIATDPLCLFDGDVSIYASLDLSYGFDTPLGSVTLFSLNLVHATLYDSALGCNPPPSELPVTRGTIFLHMTGDTEVIKVHNFISVQSNDGNGTFYHASRGIEVDYINPLKREFYYLADTTDENPSGTDITTPRPGTAITLIATDAVALGNHTIDITGDTYVYRGFYTHPADLTGINEGGGLDGDGNGGHVNAVLVGGDGNNAFTYMAGGAAILVGGGGDNYLSGGQLEFGGRIPFGRATPFPIPIPDTVQNELNGQTVIPGFTPQASGNDTLIGTPGADTLVGGDGTNRFDGLSGSDQEYGGSGNDTFSVGNDYQGSPTIYGGAGKESLSLLDTKTANNLDFSPDPQSVNVTVAADPKVWDQSVAGKHALDVTVPGGPTIVAHRMTTFGVTTDGGVVSMDDLSGTSLQGVALARSSTLHMSPLQLLVYGSVPGDALTVSSFYQPTDRTYAAQVREGLSSRVSIIARGLTAADRLTLQGKGGNDTYYVGIDAAEFASPASVFAIGVQDDVAGANNSLTVDGRAFNLGDFPEVVSVTDSAATFTAGYANGNQLVAVNVPVGFYNINTLAVIAPSFGDGEGNVINVDRASGSTEVDAGPLGDTFNATGDRTSGTTQLFGGPGDDTFNVSGRTTYTLDGRNGSDTYVISLPLLGGQTTIQDSGSLRADTLRINDATNSATLNTTYALSSNNVTRVAHDSFFGGDLPFTASVAFSPMKTVTVNTGLGTVGANYINVASTLAGAKTTVNATDGINNFSLTPVGQNLDLVAGALTLNGGSGFNALFLYDLPNPPRLFNGIFVTPTDITRQSLIFNVINPSIPPEFRNASIRYSNINELTIAAPHSAVIVDLEESSSRLGTGSLRQGTTFVRRFYFQINSQELPTIYLSNNLASLTINEKGLLAQFDVYDTPTGFATEVVLGGADNVIVHRTSGQLGIDGTGSAFLGDPLPQGGSLAGLKGMVTVGSQSGALALDVDYSGDAGQHRGRLTGGMLSGVAPTSIVLGTGIQTLTIHTGSSLGSNFTVVDTPAGATTFVDGGTGDDTVYVLATTGSLIVNPGAGNNTVNVGDATHNLDHIDGALSVDGVLGFTSLILHDESTQDITNDLFPGVDIFTLTNQVSFTVSANTVIRRNSTHSETRLDPSLLLPGQKNVPSVRNLSIFELVAYFNLGALVIKGGQSGSNLGDLLVPIPGGGQPGNIFNVQATAAGTMTTIKAGSESDTVNVGSAAKRLDGIQGLLTVNGQAGNTALNVNDQGAADFHYYNLTATDVSRLNVDAQPDMAPIQYAHIQTLTVNAGSAGDVLGASSTHAGTATILNGGAGNDEFTVFGNSNMDDMKGPITLHTNGGLYDFVQFSDFLNPVRQTYNFTATSLKRSGIALITWDPMPVGLFVSVVGTGVNHINVKSVSAGYAQSFVMGTGDILTIGSNAPARAGNLANILGPVVASGFADQTPTVIIDDSGDTTPHTSVVVDTEGMNGNVLTGLAPAPIYFRFNTAATLYGGSGGNTFNVRSSDAHRPLTINTGSGGDTVNLGSSLNQLDPIRGAVTVNGRPGGSTALNINDQGSISSHNYTLTATDVSRFDTAAVPDMAPITYAAIKTLTVNASTGTDVPSIFSTAAGTSTVINGGAGYNEFVFYGNDGTLNNINGPTTIHGGGFFYNFVVFNDSVNPVGQTYNFTATSLKRTGIALITWDPMSQVILYTGSGVDHVNVKSVSASTFESLVLGMGDILTIGSNAPALHGDLDNILGPVRAEGYAGQTSTVIVDDSGDGSAHANVVLDTAGIYGNVLTGLAPAPIYLQLDPAAPVQIKSGAGDDTFTLGNLPAGLNFTIDGGSGQNTLVGPNVASTWNITGSNRGDVAGIQFVSMQNLVGGAANDVFQFQAAGRVSGMIDGGGGTNKLDYSAYLGDILVDLLLHTASRVGQGVFNIADVTGSQGNNLLVGDANANVLTGGTGRNVIIGGGGSDRITGGGGENILIGGTTAYDRNLAALQAVMQIWDDPIVPFDQRINTLQNGTTLGGQTVALNKNTVQNDGAPDSLLGGAGQNWFIADVDDTINNGSGFGLNDWLTWI